MEIFRNGRELVDQEGKFPDGDPRLRFLLRFRASFIPPPVASHRLRVRRVGIILGSIKLTLQFRFSTLCNRDSFFLGNSLHFMETFEITITNRRLVIDGLIHQRLSEAGFVTFVMTETPVAIHVDDDISPELIAKLHCKLNDLCHALRIFPIDVENRNLEHFSDV